MNYDEKVWFDNTGLILAQFAGKRNHKMRHVDEPWLNDF